MHPEHVDQTLTRAGPPTLPTLPPLACTALRVSLEHHQKGLAPRPYVDAALRGLSAHASAATVRNNCWSKVVRTRNPAKTDSHHLLHPDRRHLPNHRPTAVHMPRQPAHPSGLDPRSKEESWWSDQFQLMHHRPKHNAADRVRRHDARRRQALLPADLHAQECFPNIMNRQH